MGISTLSRYENGPQPIPFRDLEKIFNVFGIEFNEFIDFMNSKSELTEYNELFFETLKSQNEVSMQKLHDFTQLHKSTNFNAMILYCKCVRMFHDNYPHIFSDFTQKELMEVVTRLSNQTYYSIRDYTILGLIGIKLSLKNYQILIDKMIIDKLDQPKTKYYLYSQVNHRFQFANILNNIIHVSITNQDFKSAGNYFKVFEKHVETHQLASFNQFIPYYEIIIKSEADLTLSDLAKLSRITKAMIEVNLKDQADTLQAEIDKYSIGTNPSEGDTTFKI